MTRAARKSLARAEQARTWPMLQARARLANLELALARYDPEGDDARIAFQLGAVQGPGRAAMTNAYTQAEYSRQRVTVPGCAPDSREAFETLGKRALKRWKIQAAAIERAVKANRIAPDGVWGTGAVALHRNGMMNKPITARVWSFVRLVAWIVDNEGEPWRVRVELTGKVNPQVAQSANQRAPNMVCPAANLTSFLPYVRGKLREYHPEEERRGEVGVRLSPYGTFQPIA